MKLPPERFPGEGRPPGYAGDGPSVLSPGAPIRLPSGGRVGPGFRRGSAFRSEACEAWEFHGSQRGSVPTAEAERKRENADQYEAGGPSRIQIEPAPRHEFETQVAVDQPRQESAGGNHRDGVDDADQDSHAEIGIDEGAWRLVAAIEVGISAKAEINRHEHQSRAMRDRHGKGPERQLSRSYPSQHPRMAPVDEPEDAEPDDQEAGADLDLWPPLDEGDQHREGKDHAEHRQHMADRQRP